MDAARAAINKITNKRGHTTEVEETIAPGVTREVIKPVRHEETTQAIDREVHQHHYHTTVQPLQHQEVLPEKHISNVLPTENREFRHENEREVQAKISAELGRFQDTRSVEQTRHTQSAAPTVTGEHVHHHVHETVVPIVHKETVQPEVVHSIVPVHETHHAAAQHHGLSALPVKTLDEFTRAGGKLVGSSHTTHEVYEGAPREYNSKLQTTFEKLGLGEGHGHGQHDSGIGLDSSRQHGHHGLGTGAGVGAGVGAGAAGAAAMGRHGRRGSHSSSSSSSSESDVSNGGTRRRVKKNRLGRDRAARDTTGRDTMGRDNTGKEGKPSMLDRLNPLKSSTSGGNTGSSTGYGSGNNTIAGMRQ